MLPRHTPEKKCWFEKEGEVVVLRTYPFLVVADSNTRLWLVDKEIAFI